MRGFDILGNPIVNPLTGKVTKFWHPDDPVAGTGWIDSFPSERYFLMSSGPFAFTDGDTQEVVVGIVIAQGQTGLESVALLKQNSQIAQQAYDNNFVTAVEEKTTNAPVDYALQQNFPNPFNPATTFDFSIPRDELVSLKIYNPLGEEVAVVIEKKFAAGRHQVTWNPSGLTTGLYFYRLQAGAFNQTRKLTLLK